MTPLPHPAIPRFFYIFGHLSKSCFSTWALVSSMEDGVLPAGAIQQNTLDMILSVLWFNYTSTLVGHFVLSPTEREKREEIVAMKETDREEREQEWKWRNRRNKNITPLPLSATRIAGLAQLQANISWMPQWRKIHDTIATPDHPQLWHQVKRCCICLLQHLI